MSAAEQRAADDARLRMLTHARRRAWQRLGLAVSEPDLIALSARIAAGEGKLLYDQQIRRVVCIRFRDRDVYAAFDVEHQLVLTFLPERIRFHKNPMAASVLARIAAAASERRSPAPEGGPPDHLARTTNGDHSHG